MRGDSFTYMPRKVVTPRSPPQGSTGARELFKVRFDTEKEVHHVCFVTYQAKITWATSFQVPEISSAGRASALAHLQRCTWVRRGPGPRVGTGHGKRRPLTMGSKAKGICSGWRQRLPLLACRAAQPGRPLRRGGC